MTQGHFDCVAGRDICGWAWNPAAPHSPVTVRVHIDGQIVAEGMAVQHRPDLQAAGIGDGHHAFFIPLPENQVDGRKVTLLLTGEDDTPLSGTPTIVQLPDLLFRPIEPLPHALPLTLAICAIVKDEAPYLLEWIAHHRLIGVEHFVLFDNGSRDGTTQLLSGLARKGIVDHVPWPDIPHVAAQRPAYIAGLARLAGRCQWVAFIDADEFLNPLLGESIPAILRDYDSAAGLMVPWRLFGSNGHQEAGDDLVIRRFTRRAVNDSPLNQTVKTIVQARAVAVPDIHTPKIAAGSLVDEFGRLGGTQGHPDRHAIPQARRLVLNHYFTKSLAEWQHKRERGQATEVMGQNGWLRPDSHFRTHDLNDLEDRTLADRADAILLEMQKLRELLR